MASVLGGPIQDGNTAAAHQLLLPNLGDLGEAGTYHDQSRWGYFSVMQRHDGRMHQDSYRLPLMPDVISALPRNRDSWISQAEFTKPNRQIVNLARVGVCWADLDIYKTELAHLGKDPGALVGAVLQYCDDAGLLPPSLIMHSGRGYYAKWILANPLPSAALPRWNAVQRCLGIAFRKFGADQLARDGSRVLRIENTVNTKAGLKASVVWVQSSADRQIQRYNFEDLARELLPLTREQLRERRATREQLQLLNAKNTTGLKIFSAQALNWDRLADIRKLVQLRQWHGGPIEGYQDTFLWLSTCFLALAVQPSHLYAEIVQLAREYAPSWKVQDVYRVTRTTYRRAVDAGLGRKIEYGGQLRDPRYRFTNAYLLDTLQIAPREEAQLKTIVSVAEARRRDRERHQRPEVKEKDVLRKQEARRKAGSLVRAEYISQAQARRFKAAEMRKSGLSWAEIGSALGVGPDAARKLASRTSVSSVCILA